MGFLDRLADLGKNLLADAEREFARVTSRHTFERVCQAAFLIAQADGSFAPAEKDMLQKLIAAKLPHYTAREIAAAVNAAEGELAFSVDGGIGMLLSSIGKARDTADADLVMLVAVAIAGADGDFDAAERAMAGRIADALGVDRGRFGL